MKHLLFIILSFTLFACTSNIKKSTRINNAACEKKIDERVRNTSKWVSTGWVAGNEGDCDSLISKSLKKENGVCFEQLSWAESDDHFNGTRKSEWKEVAMEKCKKKDSDDMADAASDAANNQIIMNSY